MSWMLSNQYHLAHVQAWRRYRGLMGPFKPEPRLPFIEDVYRCKGMTLHLLHYEKIR